jgi:2-dehydropantoate 2-reductase
MKIIIFGAGAIGSYFGASLLLGGNEVVFLEREPAAGVLKRSGITMKRKGLVQKVSGLRIFTDYEEIAPSGPFDLGILAVKSYDTEGFIAGIRMFKDILPPILSLQNGVANEDILSAFIGREKVIAGSVTTAIGREGTGEIVVEKLRGVGIAGSSELVSEIVKVFNESGLIAKGYPRVLDMKWSKMLTNLQANATSAILNMLPGEIYANRKLFSLEMEQLREALEVMRAQEIKVVDLPRTPVRLLAAGSGLPFWLGQPIIGSVLGKGRGDKQPSFLIEIQNKTGKSEVAFLNGAVVSHGKEKVISTPINSVLTNTLMGIVSGNINQQDFDHQPERLLDLVRIERAKV